MIPEKWLKHIEYWQRSGLKQADYCRQQQINYATFSARLSEHRKSSSKELPAVLPVKIQPVKVTPIILKFSNGTQIEFAGQPSATWLAELLKCLN